ncbi:MAG: CoA pyrophosphatase [Bacteroidota bacterium]
MKLKLQDLREISNFPLGGENSHRKLSPKMRESAADIRRQKTDFKQSAVMLLIYEKQGELFLPLIQRNTYNGAHSGQISFPGGQFEDQDSSFAHTAIRECHEEIGVLCPEESIIKELSEIYIPPSNFMVKPFLALLAHLPVFQKEPSEVEHIIEYPIQHLLSEDSIKETKVYISTYDVHIKVPAFVFKDYIIWGATAIILSELKDLIKNITES